MTAVTSESDIGDHECTGFEFGEDIFFADADGYPSWLCEIGDSACEEGPIFDCIEDREYLFCECFTMFLQEMRDSSYTINS